ncbi:hypothetical protein, partial [Serratia marcescens]|uniref:hypothetical protein n=1 Tax=Serratia marcescens TaxID=615 RepID=UPI0019549F44
LGKSSIVLAMGSGGLVQNYAGLIAFRLVLGALEAGLFPGMNMFLTLFYTKHELGHEGGRPRVSD